MANENTSETPVSPVIPDLTGAFLSGDTQALKNAVHDRVVTQVQSYVNNPDVLTGKTDPK